MIYKEFKKVEIPQSILDTTIIDWDFRDSITYDRGKYCVRFTLFFQSGKEKLFQQGGFKTRKQAIKAKEQLIVQLNNHTYIPYKFTVQEFWDYYLYYYMVDDMHCSYNTFVNYKNLTSYFYSVISPNTLMIDVTREMLIKVFLSYPSPWLRRSAYGMICSAFRVAVNKNIIASDPSVSAKAYVKKTKSEEDALSRKKRNRSFSLEELNTILSRCQEIDPDFYLFLLFSAATGTRISEARAICFSDIDFINKKVTISHQLGRDFSKDGTVSPFSSQQFVPLKTRNAYRTIPLPDFLLDELILAKRKKEIEKKNDEFYLKEPDFVFTTYHGYPLTRSGDNSKRFKKILTECGMDASFYHWHDLRHTYATLLRHENPKAVSKILGHCNSEFTEKVYVDTSKDVHGLEEMKYMDQYIQQLFAKESEYFDLMPVQDIMNQLFDVSA